MTCPYCNATENKVIDSRISKEKNAIRRRRQCFTCLQRFTTYEYVDKIQLMIIKKDGRREPFNRNKIINGILKACKKRSISRETIEKIAEEIEKEIEKKDKKEISSKKIGGLVINALQKLDEIACVRFASVYRQFKNINEFMDEIKTLGENNKEE